MDNGSFLGIDWGASDVGVATADSETRIAFAKTTLKNDSTLLERLLEIIKEESVSTIIIGVPSHINRKEVEYAGEKLGKKLLKVCPEIVVFYQDEMFTTKMAQQNLIERGMKRVSQHDDEEAARIILQSWLDQKKI